MPISIPCHSFCSSRPVSKRLGYAGAYVWLLRQAARGRARLGLAFGLLLLALPYLIGWYVIWPLALAAWDDDDEVMLLSLALCAYLLPQRLT